MFLGPHKDVTRLFQWCDMQECHKGVICQVLQVKNDKSKVMSQELQVRSEKLRMFSQELQHKSVISRVNSCG